MGVSSLCSLTAVSGCLATPYPLYSAGPTTLRLWDQRNLCPFQFFCSGVFTTVTNISLTQCFTSIIYRQRIIITLANMYYLCVKCWPQGLNAGASLIHATIRHGGTFSIPFKTQKLNTSSRVTDGKTRMNFSLNSQLQASVHIFDCYRHVPGFLSGWQTPQKCCWIRNWLQELDLAVEKSGEVGSLKVEGWVKDHGLVITKSQTWEILAIPQAHTQVMVLAGMAPSKTSALCF